MRKTNALAGLTEKAQENLEVLGNNILVSIQRRAMTREEVADKAMLSLNTLRSIIRGEATVSMGCYIAVLSVVGLDDDIAEVAKPENDEVGSALALRQLPRRVRKKESKYDI